MYLGTSNMEPMKHHQHKSRGQTFDWNCIFEEYEWKRKKLHGACYLPQNRNLMIHVPKQHIVFWCTAEGKDYIMRRAQSLKVKMKSEPPQEDFRIKRVPGYRVHGCHVGTVGSQNNDNSKIFCAIENKYSNHFWKLLFLQKQNQALRNASVHQQCGEPITASQRLGIPLLYQFCLSGTEDFKLEPK